MHKEGIMDNNEAKWYVIHTYSAYENMVETNLRNMIENNNLQDKIFDIKIPVEDDIVEKDGKRKVVQRKKFKGYVFVKMIYTNEIWYLITNTRGVTGFVGPKGRPVPISNDEVRRMGLEDIIVEDFAISVGDKIQVIAGALDGFPGEVIEVINDKQKVKAVISMFGRDTTVELDFSQIEKI